MYKCANARKNTENEHDSDFDCAEHKESVSKVGVSLPGNKLLDSNNSGRQVKIYLARNSTKEHAIE